MRPSIAGRRRSSTRLPATIVGLALVVAACGSSSPSPSPSSSPAASPGLEAGYRLRVTTVQALPPLDLFTLTPQLVITDDLVAIQQGVIPLIFPGPLVMPLLGTQLTDEAWTKIVAEARAAGLLSGETDFSGGALPPGSVAGRLQLVVDGTTYDLTGDPNKVAFCGDTLCPAEPGTPEAFATFVSLLGDLHRWIGAGVGGNADWAPTGYAVLVGPPPPDEQGLAVAPKPWPFETPASEFGKPVTGQPDHRCGTVTGAEAAAFTVALESANQLTTWRDPAAANDLGLVVRPLLPGDGDPCAPLVGG
jgi:hypothetical protein